jgi:2-iminobutanoate/2-iminopropanoate deaminase
VLNSIRRTIESEGGQMSDVFKLVQYFKNLDHFPLYNGVRKLFFPDGAPASTVVQVSAMLPTEDMLIEVEATAYLPQRSSAAP